MIPSIKQWTWYILKRFAGIVVGIISAPSYELAKDKSEVNPSTNVLPKTVTLSLRRKSKLTDDANYNAGETCVNVPSPLSGAGNHDNYYCRRLWTRYVLLSRLGNNEVNPLL
ncbi:unnamed protein product [Protopolystoma xenopodis]|uniref:Uncharacterized protein n=1 Tax=Protopolystoma xenopodis TaxID=117903 RepID=A0A3S5CH44_9PLAT|nr:unnamed protein product [Protopolystoma xenopodis]